MGLRFRRTLSMGPLRLNLSRRGVGVTSGMRGLRVGRSANGRFYVTLGLPGTGLSYTWWLGKRR
ncbi:MAG: DUF4236 domain-containing protein [Chthonomonadales bacterium]